MIDNSSAKRFIDQEYDKTGHYTTTAVNWRQTATDVYTLQITDT